MRVIGTAAVVILGALCSCTSASALTITSSGGTVQIVGGSGEVNEVSLRTDADHIYVDSFQPRGLVAGEGCTAYTERQFQYGECPRAGVAAIDVRLGDRSDTLLVSSVAASNPPINYSGGPGVDSLYSSGDDTEFASVSLDDTANDGFGGADNVHSDVEILVGSESAESLSGDAAANRISGGAGADTLRGEGGNDRISGHDPVDCHQAPDCELHQPDVISCGPGVDVVDGDERDVIDADCEVVARNDVLLGTAAADSIVGFRPGLTIRSGSGDDDLTGLGDDVLEGGSGDDRLREGHGYLGRLAGGPGDDDLRGSAGQDWIAGGSGRDRLIAAGGKDRIRGGAGRDAISGGGANDRIDVRDGERDTVSCGSGKDVVKADRRDRVARSCETVNRSPAPR